MPQFLITYDLAESRPSPHRPFLDAAEGEDLLYVYRGASGDLLRLPNTTLWGNFADAKAAAAAFDRARTVAERAIGRRITVEKRAITGISGALFRSDVRKAPEADLTEATGFETCRRHQLEDPFFS